MSAQPEHTGTGDVCDPITLADVNGPATWCSCTTESVLCSAGEILVLQVAGEIDLCTLPNLQVALHGSLKRRPAHLVVDLARMTYCSVRGLDLLTEAGRTATKKATGYAVSGVPPHTARIWTLGWDDVDLPVRYRSTAAAVTALRAAG